MSRLSSASRASHAPRRYRWRGLAPDPASSRPAPDLVPVVADRGELDILFSSLVSNAVKYDRTGGRVDISIQPDAAGVRFAVADASLLLSIVKKLAQLYDGDVSVESEPGAGSRFTVVLKTQPATGVTP